MKFIAKIRFGKKPKNISNGLKICLCTVQLNLGKIFLVNYSYTHFFVIVLRIHRNWISDLDFSLILRNLESRKIKVYVGNTKENIMLTLGIAHDIRDRVLKLIASYYEFLVVCLQYKLPVVKK